MQYVLLLIVVAIIGFLLAQQLQKPAATPEPVTVSSENTPPTVPTKAQDVEQFGKDMSQFLQDSAKDQLKDVDKMTK